MGDPDWVFEYVMQVLQSPTWEVPIMSFVDETCAIFDDEDENKLAHSEAHRHFRQVVEALLTQHLAEVGVPAEDFFEACETAYRGSGEAAEMAGRIVEQLVACEDFLTFKTLMFRRNRELEAEALLALQYGDDFNGSDDEEEEEASVLADLRVASLARGRDGAESKTGDSFRAHCGASSDGPRAAEEDAARLREIAELDREQAELEAAIAMSLAVEEERLLSLSDRAESKLGDDDDGDDLDEPEREGKSGEGKRADKSRALPPLAQQRSMLEQSREAAARVMSRAATVSGADGHFDEVDVARRKRHLEAQRKKLLAKKAAERAAQLETYSQEQQQQQQQQGGPKTKLAQEQSTAAQPAQRAVNGDLTHALARRMKQDLLAGREASAADAKPFSSALDEKLRQVEDLRTQRAQLLRNGF